MPDRRLADNRLPLLTPVTPSGLLLTTTDTRMQKPNHLAHDPTVELAWWIEDPAIQFRITGKAYTIPTDPSEVQGVLDKIGLDGEDAKAEFWEDKRKDLWKNLSGHLRGSFGRPPPGKKLDEIEEKPEDWISRLDVESVSRACIIIYWVHRALKCRVAKNTAHGRTIRSRRRTLNGRRAISRLSRSSPRTPRCSS